ncbi:MAG: PEP-CTERM sorting domain-containing protein [Cytophagaceae bacterium]|nr:MAG: PEP-CTERM sorting domain-containing protein [Cytophagaceae bacterium]
MQDLDALLSAGGLLPVGWTTEYANAVAIGPDGLLTIAGSGTGPDGRSQAFVAAIPAPVPEPATMTALALGAFTLMRRKRRG